MFQKEREHLIALELEKEDIRHRIALQKKLIKDKIKIMSKALVRSILKHRISVSDISRSTLIYVPTIKSYVYYGINIPHHNYKLIFAYVDSVTNEKV